ncbi:DNA gyrase C-terminal beta-propeller domain-containing protein, partial [Streptococcus sobrinus]
NGHEDIMIMTDTGVIIRTGISNISQTGRSTIGVKVMRLDENAKIVTLALIETEENDEEEKEKEVNEES